MNSVLDRFLLALAAIIALASVMEAGWPYFIVCGMLGWWAGNAAKGDRT